MAEKKDVKTEETQKNSGIFVGGLTQEMVDKWKGEYGQVFATPYDDVTFVWRTISRSEYKQHIARIRDWLDREEEVCEVAVLWPKNFNFKDGEAKAGYAALISENILDASGFVAAGPIIEL